MSLLTTIVRPLGRALRGRRADESLSVTRSPQLQTERRLDVRSANFVAGGVIPHRCCGRGLGPNISPQLGWSPVPDKTAWILVILEDIDTPTKVPGIHTAVSFPADRDELAEGELTADGYHLSYLRHRPITPRYYGPQPLPGHGPHHYRFHVYATDTVLDLSGLRRVDQLPGVASGHVLAAGMLEGTREAV